MSALARPRAAIGLAMVALWLVCALFAPALAPFDPLRSDSAPFLLPLSANESGTHWLGSDMLGRDILSRLIWGARAVVLWAGLATASAYAVGISTGLVAGFYRGATDRALSFLANVMLAFPLLVLYLVIIVRLGASGANIILAATFGTAPAIFRIVRALTLDQRDHDYVSAAITQGENPLRIMAVEILPNVLGPVVVDACLRLGYTAIMIGALGFLGLGLPPPTPDWGGMINEGRAMAIAFPHLVIFPCIAISSLMLGLSLVADGLRMDAPRAGAGGT